MARLWALIIGYAFGNLLFASIIGKLFLHANPTQVGSGNPGTANIGAVFGKKWGILTCLGDLGKSLAAMFIVYFALPPHLNLAYAALGLILGHCFPCWNHFNGGKGVAVAAQVIVFYDWRAGFPALLLGLLLLIFMQNLTIPPLAFMLVYSLYLCGQNLEAAFIFSLITLIMAFKFRHDLVAFFTGRGKKVDILKTIKKKLRN